MRENLVIQVGQCGNQIGNEFWERISLEHGINRNGILLDPKENDRKDAFFYETDDNRFIPRSILIDLEPRVVQSISSTFYNQDNIFLDSKGGGAGNNWAHGYFKGKEYKNEVFEMIQREFESCDNLETFIFLHSIAGGTGSGFGSLLLENLDQVDFFRPNGHNSIFSAPKKNIKVGMSYLLLSFFLLVVIKLFKNHCIYLKLFCLYTYKLILYLTLTI